jgi:hypothetical protein
MEEGSDFASLSKCFVAVAVMPLATARWSRRKEMRFS